MPDKRTLLDPFCWQPLPGSDTIRIFPIESRPNLLSSNTYILSGRDMIAVIDPGADPRQAKQISDTLNACIRECPRPVVILFTHCHRDHVRETGSLEIDAAPIVIAHEAGAKALVSGDRGLTMAGIFGEEAPCCEVHITLFPSTDRVSRPRITLLSCGRTLTVSQAGACKETGNLSAEIITIGNESLLVFHAPGHSPDSIWIKAGSTLFCGDLLAAARPLVAGIAGWDQGSLIASLRGIMSMLASGGITVLSPGHAFSLPTDEAASILRRTLSDAEAIGSLELIDESRIRLLADYTRTLIDEIGHSMAVISGRLGTASFHLDALGEHMAAEEALKALDVLGIDTVLDSFRSHLDDVLDGRSLILSLPHKGMSIIPRIDSILRNPALGEYVPQQMLGRTRRMISDFMLMMQGIRCRASEIPADIGALLNEVRTLALTGGLTEEDLEASLDDEAAFARALGRRIVQRPVAAGVNIDISLCGEMPPVNIDRDRFIDHFTALIELLAAHGAEHISFSACPEGASVRLDISAGPGSVLDSVDARRLHFLDISLKQQGGSCLLENGEIVVRIPAAN
jgi:glyoxylase-like metal-dependent hydrolase (beta-lactamase superfamily II)